MPARARLVLPGGRGRVNRLIRAVRAIWRDTTVLWREFNRPIIVFLIATLIGGYVYGEVHVLAGHERIPYIDLPYMMLSLMVLGTPLAIPSEPFLILFWYAMPLVALYVVGRGAADFIGLFFDRSGRRDAWEEAVASTYRQHTIVVGVGHVGLRVTRTLVQMGFDVVGIDQKFDEDKDEELSRLGVPAIVGDARQRTILETAGLPLAQSLVVCTSNDHTNLEVVMRARDLNPDIRIIVRMWDDQFANQLARFMNVQAVLSASDLAAPAFAGAAVGIEITQTLTIHGIDYSMIRLKVEPGSFLDAQEVGKLQDNYDMDIVLLGRDDNVDVQPDNRISVKAGDTLVIFARHDNIINIVDRNRHRNAKRG